MNYTKKILVFVLMATCFGGGTFKSTHAMEPAPEALANESTIRKIINLHGRVVNQYQPLEQMIENLPEGYECNRLYRSFANQFIRLLNNLPSKKYQLPKETILTILNTTIDPLKIALKNLTFESLNFSPSDAEADSIYQRIEYIVSLLNEISTLLNTL